MASNDLKWPLFSAKILGSALRSGIHSGIHWLCFIIKSISDIQHTSLLVKEKTPQRPLRHPFTPDGQNGRGVLGVYIYIYYYYYFKKIKSCSNGQKKLAICHHLPPVPRSQVPPADAIDKLCCKVGFAGRGPRSNTNGEGKRRRGLFLKPSKK